MQWTPFAFGALALLVGAVLAFAGAREVQARRAIARIPTSGTGALWPGPVEVQGRVALAPGGAPVRGRFTDATGAMGVWRVQELRKSGKSSKWVTLHEDREAPVFAVDDGTGPALVDVEVADLDVEPTHVAESRMGRDPPPRVLAYLRERRIPHEGWFGVNRRMRFTETLLPVGEALYVLGVAEPAPKGTRARCIIRTGRRDAPFIVSTRGERGVARRKLRTAVGLFVGAFVFLGVGAVLAWSGATG